ncbi:hypothetical protein BH10ACT3_BH10ACT3_10850 [soil metagenome]
MIGQVFALVGAILILSAGLGVVRFGDVFARMHSLTKGSTLGVVLVLVGAAIYLDRPNDWTSLLLAAAAQLLSSPIAANVLGRSTYLLQLARELDSEDNSATRDTAGDDTADEDVR